MIKMAAKSVKQIQGSNFSSKEFEKLVAENEKRLKKVGYADEKQVKALVEEAIKSGAEWVKK